MVVHALNIQKISGRTVVIVVSSVLGSIDTAGARAVPKLAYTNRHCRFGATKPQPRRVSKLAILFCWYPQQLQVKGYGK